MGIGADLRGNGDSYLSFRRRPESRETTVNKQPVVYVLASKRKGTLYIRVTSDLVKRVWEHRNNMVEDLLNVMVFINWSGMKCTKVWNPPLSGRNN